MCEKNKGHDKMKITSKKNEVDFQPIEVTFTIESLKEFDSIVSIFGGLREIDIKDSLNRVEGRVCKDYATAKNFVYSIYSHLSDLREEIL